MRRHSSTDDLLSFGGRVPPVIGGLIITLLAASILGAVGGFAGLAAFQPARVLGLELWRLVTWVFFERDPLSLIFGGLTLFWFGRDLTWAWGPRRFLATWFGIAAGAAAVTTVLSLFFPQLRLHFWLGAWPVLSALIVAWATIFPDRQILFMFALPISGQTLLWITVGGTVLYAIFGNPWAYVPHLVAQGLMALLLRGFSARGLLQRLRLRELERRARRRASHLKVVKKSGGGDPPRWMN